MLNYNNNKYRQLLTDYSTKVCTKSVFKICLDF